MITMITPSEPIGQLLIDKAAYRKYKVPMYRVLFEDGTISDLLNMSRAKDLLHDEDPIEKKEESAPRQIMSVKVPSRDQDSSVSSPTPRRRKKRH